MSFCWLMRNLQHCKLSFLKLQAAATTAAASFIISSLVLSKQQQQQQQQQQQHAATTAATTAAASCNVLSNPFYPCALADSVYVLDSIVLLAHCSGSCLDGCLLGVKESNNSNNTRNNNSNNNSNSSNSNSSNCLLFCYSCIPNKKLAR